MHRQWLYQHIADIHPWVQRGVWVLENDLHLGAQPAHLVAMSEQTEGQIEGAAAMSIGQALCEQVVFDKNGRTLNPSFVDYLMPTINMMPRIETTLVHGYPGSGPYGAKGAGEIACVPPMACIANAIFNATGVRINKLPLSPENVLRGLKEAGKA